MRSARVVPVFFLSFLFCGSALSREIVAYFPEWGVYQQAPFLVRDIVDAGSADDLTVLIYAFAIPGPNGSGQIVIQLDDPWAAYQRVHSASESLYYPTGDTSYQALRGHFNQLRKLKEDHPQLKILVALGGWTGSTYFSDAALTAESRRVFVESCIDMFIHGNLPVDGGAGGAGVADGIFDGFDIDWEYPITGGEGGTHHNSNDDVNLSLLLEEFRSQFASTGRSGLLLTIATPASDFRGQNFRINNDQQYVDWFNIMTYDFHGTWDQKTGHLTNLLTSPNDPSSDAFKLSVDNSVRLYRDTYQVSPQKLVIGGTFYGRGWQGVSSTNDGLYQSGQAAPGIYEDGYNYYKDLIPLQGYQMYWDDLSLASWLYNPAAKIFWTLDDPQSLALKSRYADAYGLGGLMVWEITGDDANGTLLASLVTGNPQGNGDHFAPDGDGSPPAVEITSPDSCALSFEGFNIVINAKATGQWGGVEKVEFFLDDVSLGYDNRSPFSWAAFNLTPGPHVLTAEAIDNDGSTSTSAPVSINVYGAGSGTTLWQTGATYNPGDRVFYLGCIYEATRLHVGSRVREPSAGSRYWKLITCSDCGTNQPPTVSILSPGDGATFEQGVAITIGAEADDADGPVPQVEFFADGSSLGVDGTSPYSITWSNAGVGGHSLTAVATDNQGSTSVSAPVSITVTSSGGGGCSDPAWNSTQFYPRGTLVSHNDRTWKAKRDNQGVEPGTSPSMWVDQGACPTG